MRDVPTDWPAETAGYYALEGTRVEPKRNRGIWVGRNYLDLSLLVGERSALALVGGSKGQPA